MRNMQRQREERPVVPETPTGRQWGGWNDAVKTAAEEKEQDFCDKVPCTDRRVKESRVSREPTWI